jgi:hypothetical protein
LLGWIVETTGFNVAESMKLTQYSAENDPKSDSIPRNKQRIATLTQRGL